MRPRDESFGVVPPPPSSTGDDIAEASSGAAADANVSPPTTSDDSDIRRMLDHVSPVQAAHKQILVDVLDEIHGLRIELAQFRWSSSPPPFDDGFWLRFGIPSQKGGVHFETLVVVFVFRERFFFFFFLVLELVEIRLYLGASLCIYLFGSWCIGLFILREDTFIVSYVSCFTSYWFIFMMLFIDICLYFVFCEIKNSFRLLVFSIHAFMHLV